MCVMVFILPLTCFRNTFYLCHPTLPQCHHRMVSVQKTYNTGGGGYLGLIGLVKKFA